MSLSVKQKQTHRLTMAAKRDVGERGGVDWEFGISRYKLLHIEWMSIKLLPYSTGNAIQHPVILHN